jgi:hypothetical protein
VFLPATPLLFAFEKDLSAFAEEKQVTAAPYGHIVANVGIWSPDSQWIAYDCRDMGEVFNAERIERVNVDTGEVRVVYQAPAGSACGVATWHPSKPVTVFIQGPEPGAPEWPYGVSRRRGVLVNAQSGEVRPLDAMNFAPPLTPGALRGGSHVHVFSGDGKWVSFTYEDELLTRPGQGVEAEPNRRTVGVSAPFGPVEVNDNHPRNHDGDSFTVIACETVSDPRPGSNEIGRAFEEGWIGRDGYVRADGIRQKYALAFQGEVVTTDGRKLPEVFVVDIPEDPTHEGRGPIEGTLTSMPSPPAGTEQRRLTFTENRAYPGIQGPRHWLRSSPDGENIAFLMRDDSGVVQLFLISPRGGEPRQLTSSRWDVTSTFTWSPDGRWISCVRDNSVWIVDAETGDSYRLTAHREDADAPHRSACVFSPDGSRIAYLRGVDGHRQIFTVSLPPEDHF